MRYARARYEKDRRELAYRIFVTDGISLHAQGKYISERYIDFVRPVEIDNRPAEEIAADILARAGVEVISN